MKDPFASLDAEERELLGDEDAPTYREPMLATLTDERFSDPDWVFEAKLDGVRAVAVRDGDEVCLYSRQHKLMNATYPEIVDALGELEHDRFVVDGEIVAFENDRTSFQKLQSRMGLQDPEKARRTGVEVFYYLFDVMHLDGRDVTQLPLRTRKSTLKQAIVFEDPLRYSTHRNERGKELYEEACRQGWEGLIAKRAASSYRSGSRAKDWLKFKCVNEQEFVIGGFTDPKGSRAGFGALLVGYYEEDAFRYAGKVGTGFSDRVLEELRSTFDRLERKTSPFDDDVAEKSAHWVTPKLVCEVGFGEWTDDGRLRHPRFKGLRDDKDPQDVVREDT